MSSILAFSNALKCARNIVSTRYFILVVCIGLIVAGAGVLKGCDVKRIKLEGSFDEQVAAVMARRQMHARDWRAVYRAMGETERAFQTLWPDAKLVPLGSLVTGLATPNSDVDCHVVLPSSCQTNWSQVLEAAATTLQLYPELFTNVTVHIGRVPVVQTVHVPTNRQFDIDFTEGSYISNLMKYLLHTDRKFITLTVIVKCWAELLKHKGERKISTHIFVFMVIFFLQQKQLIPPVAELQNNAGPLLKKHWNVAFQRKDYEPKSDLSLFGLLVGYFEFYANFAYDDYVISPFIGYPIHRVRFLDYQSLPVEFRLYKLNISNNITRPMDLSGTIKVQDPFFHNLNLVSTHTMPRLVVQRALAAFKKANEIYQENSNPDKFLLSILEQK